MAREQVQMEVRQRIAVNLVVHLDGLDQIGDRSRDEHRVTPERGLSICCHLERFDDVVAGDDAHVAGKWSDSLRRYPT